MQMSCLLLTDFCLCRPASHTRGGVSTPAASTGFPDLWLELSTSFLLPKPPPAPHHKCHFPQPHQPMWMWLARSKKLGSPQVRETELCSLETHTCEMCKSHTETETSQLQLLLAIKMATFPVQAASFYRPSQTTCHHFWSLLQRPLPMVLPYFFSQTLWLCLV